MPEMSAPPALVSAPRVIMHDMAAFKAPAKNGHVRPANGYIRPVTRPDITDASSQRHQSNQPKQFQLPCYFHRRSPKSERLLAGNVPKPREGAPPSGQSLIPRLF